MEAPVPTLTNVEVSPEDCPAQVQSFTTREAPALHECLFQIEPLASWACYNTAPLQLSWLEVLQADETALGCQHIRQAGSVALIARARPLGLPQSLPDCTGWQAGLLWKRLQYAPTQLGARFVDDLSIGALCCLPVPYTFNSLLEPYKVVV